jgi:outer membrane immunogenic protein
MGASPKKSLLATGSIVALTAATAVSAADLPVKARPPAVVTWNWTGPYIGVNAGAAKHRSHFFDFGDPTCCQLAFTNQQFFSTNRWRGTVGGQAGYNWQFGNVVTGVEADINWIGKSSATIPSDFFGAAPVFTNADINWFATARGRLGWAFSNTLVYATGGLAVARLSNSWGFVGQTPYFSYEATKATWTVGGGIEHMLTKNWTARAEVLYADFGTSPIQTISGFAGNYQSKFTNALTIVRGGLNWKW